MIKTFFKFLYIFLILYIFIVLMTSCRPVRSIRVSSLKSCDSISVFKEFILLNNKPVGKYINTEFECYKGKCLFEISVELYNMQSPEMLECIMKFLAEKHPQSKIEIKLK